MAGGFSMPGPRPLPPFYERARPTEVRRAAQPAGTAGLLIAMGEGYGSPAKNAQEPEVMKAGIKTS
ncbi:MAG: hypothetical protein WBM24_10585 [Candidatus Sulfotelmatobacter sp.]